MQLVVKGERQATQEPGRGMWIEDSGTASGSDAAEHKKPNRLSTDIANIQAFIASLPDRDTRSPEDLIGYDETGLPS
jgi:hypothetical protein